MLEIRPYALCVLLIGVTACVPDGASAPKLSSLYRTDAQAPGPLGQSLDAGSQIGSPDTRAPQCRVDAGNGFPDANAPPPPEEEPMCNGPNKPMPTHASVYYGTEFPSHVRLNAGQISSVANFGGCSGLFITPRWILTASHCGIRRGREVCIGHGPEDEDACFQVSQVHDHPSADMSLVDVGEDARQRLQGLEPIPIITETLDRNWLGRTAEAAGYGAQETGRSGRREFTAEPIVDFYSDNIVIDGQGQRGVCFGDSGGPLFVVASDGSTRIGGVLSHGDTSCVGRDNFTRVDLYKSWIESYTGPTPRPGPQPCGAIDAEGHCSMDRARATYCQNNELQIDECDSGNPCAWSTAAQGWRCLDPALDPCSGQTYAGSCNQNVLRWCDRGQIFERNCQACGEACIPLRDDRGNFCIPSDCGDLTFQGRCMGDNIEWCNREGRRETRHCENGCSYIDAETGYFCR
jgi:hypothetical protein